MHQDVYVIRLGRKAVTYSYVIRHSCKDVTYNNVSWNVDRCNNVISLNVDRSDGSNS